MAREGQEESKRGAKRAVTREAESDRGKRDRRLKEGGRRERERGEGKGERRGWAIGMGGVGESDGGRRSGGAAERRAGRDDGRRASGARQAQWGKLGRGTWRPLRRPRVVMGCGGVMMASRAALDRRECDGRRTGGSVTGLGDGVLATGVLADRVVNGAY